MEAECCPQCLYVSITLHGVVAQKSPSSRIYLLDSQFQVLDVLLETSNLLLELLLALEQLVAGILFLLQPFLRVLEGQCSNSEILLHLETKPNKNDEKSN